MSSIFGTPTMEEDSFAQQVRLGEIDFDEIKDDEFKLGEMKFNETLDQNKSMGIVMLGLSYILT